MTLNPGKRLEQLARTQQEIGVARPPEALVANREGLVDDDPAWRERAGEGRKQRPVQIIRHDDPVVAAAERRQGINRRASFEIDLPHGAAISGKRLQRLDVAVDRRHAKPHI